MSSLSPKNLFVYMVKTNNFFCEGNFFMGQKNVIEYRMGKLKKIISFEENTREGNFQFEGKK